MMSLSNDLGHRSRLTGDWQLALTINHQRSTINHLAIINPLGTVGTVGTVLKLSKTVPNRAKPCQTVPRTNLCLL